jgi:peptidoglycan/xylan/chitin deacetylase (PgdA/CDA1 family)
VALHNAHKLAAGGTKIFKIYRGLGLGLSLGQALAQPQAQAQAQPQPQAQPQAKGSAASSGSHKRLAGAGALLLTLLCLSAHFTAWANPQGGSPSSPQDRARASANEKPVEIHNRIRERESAGTPNSPKLPTQQVALTLDACSGSFDQDLMDFLVRNRIPATLFATKRWLDRNAAAVKQINAHPDLFVVEDHGENHIPAVIGSGRKVYGIAGMPDLAHLRREVTEGAKAVTAATGVAPHWYRGATAVYDPAAADEIRRLGYKIAGFSVNADAGATLSRRAVAERLRQVKGGDVIIAHINKPASDTAEGMAVGLLELLRRGFVFVRLDQVDLVEVQSTNALPTAR